MNFNDKNEVTINRTEEVNPEGTGGEELKLTIETGYDTNVVTSYNIDQDNDEIKITAGPRKGSSTQLTVKYGKHTAEACTIQIAEDLTSISAKSVVMISGHSKKLEVTTQPADNVEKLTYTSADQSKVEISEDGTITAKELPEGEEMARVEITVAGSISTEVKTTCIVEVQKLGTTGNYIKYDVGYIDMYKEYEYTSTNGWRLLNYTKNEDGTYKDVELISTGIPTILHYSYNTDTAKSINGWWEENKTLLDKFKNEQLGSSYVLYRGTDENYTNYPIFRASAGMFYNFENIKFSQGTSANANKGYFTKITNGSNEYSTGIKNKTGAELFKTNENCELRTLTLPEIHKAQGETDIDKVGDGAIQASKDTKGIYVLNQLKVINGIDKVLYNNGRYWLASPLPYENSSNIGVVIFYDGLTSRIPSQTTSDSRGIRPVVKLKGSNLKIQAIEDGSYCEITQ